jgi:hypothetical protein
LLLHLTDWELLRYSPVPVLLVKSKKPYRNPVVLAAVDPTHANAKPTQLDDEILKAAVTVRAAMRGSLHAVHAFVPLPFDAKPSELLDEHAAERLEERARTAAPGRLTRFWEKCGCHVATDTCWAAIRSMPFRSWPARSTATSWSWAPSPHRHQALLHRQHRRAHRGRPPATCWS